MFKNLENIIKISGVIVAVVSLSVGLYEYSANNEREFRKNFFARQNAVYEDLLDDLGNISAWDGDTDKLTEFKTAEDHFEKLYYGKLNLYQNGQIELKTDSLYMMISDLKDNYNLSSMDSTVRNIIKLKCDTMQDLIYDLSQTCKYSLAHTYKVSDDDMDK